jgi:ABC-2 type transport system ATP-binding protein
LKQEILELKKKGATIIISTHNMASVEEICDDIVLIDHAKKILKANYLILNRIQETPILY